MAIKSEIQPPEDQWIHDDFLAQEFKRVREEGFRAGYIKGISDASFKTHRWADNVFNAQGDMKEVKRIREHAELLIALQPSTGKAE